MNMPSIRRPKMPARPAVARRSAGVMATRVLGGLEDAGMETGSCGIGAGRARRIEGTKAIGSELRIGGIVAGCPAVRHCNGWPKQADRSVIVPAADNEAEGT